MNNLTGSFNLYFKTTIPEKARIVPNVTCDEITKCVYIPFASITPRKETIEFRVNGDTYDFSQDFIYVEDKNGDYVFGNKEIKDLKTA
jgi:hypothetical protein